jgi:hypothetical protein
MARVVFASYFFRYPLGGMVSWALQYLLGIQSSGHEVCLVERADYPDAFYCPDQRVMTNDPSTGLRKLKLVLERFELDKWRLVDYFGRGYGMSDLQFSEFFRSADLLIDGGNHGAWLPFVKDGQKTVLIDGEPGYTQIRWENGQSNALDVDMYFTNGMLLGTPGSRAPTAGKSWRPLFNPVMPSFFTAQVPRDGSTWTTIMNWQSHGTVEYAGKVYGQKDLEFPRILDLPARAPVLLSVGVSGEAPFERLTNAGWIVQDAQQITQTIEGYKSHIYGSRGELSVCKNVFVALRTGWFSDRSAAFLASGRPVILQDTGFSEVLPTGEGLFGFQCIDEALTALDAIESDYTRHSLIAREIAQDYLAADKVMAGLVETALG